MSAGDLDANASRRMPVARYNAHHPVPTIERYENIQQHRDEQSRPVDGDTVSQSDDGPGIVNRAIDKVKSRLSSNGSHAGAAADGQPKPPYESQNQNQSTSPNHDPSKDASQQDPSKDASQQDPSKDASQDTSSRSNDPPKAKEDHSDKKKGPSYVQDAIDGVVDPKKKRKAFHHSQRDHREREVTDPVTHLPIAIHDTNKDELERVPENICPPAASPNASTHDVGQSANKSEQDSGARSRNDDVSPEPMERLFPPPSYEEARAELIWTFQSSFSLGLAFVLMGFSIVIVLVRLLDLGMNHIATSWTGLVISTALLVSFVLCFGGFIIWVLRGWIENKVTETWHNQVWEAERRQGESVSKSQTPESTQWLNSILAAVWPVVNPDLFTSLADTLEDVMQASLPKMVRMISVDDLGQGSESLRILGIKWLPPGLAASTVSVDGRKRSDVNSGSNSGPDESDRTVQGEGEVQKDSQAQDERSQSSSDKNDDKEENQDVAEGMEAEEGDFVNMEVAFAYRARASGRSLKTKAKNAHLFLVFYLPGNIRFPVWVELRGMVGTLRMRLQLTQDPPFFALCTLTFLGQPEVDLSCVPLTKRGLNVMDLPLVSGFVQSSVDAAMAEYVAPKSLTLDLKDMIVGDDFKKDTAARGVLVITIKRAWDFKEADGALGGLIKGSSDSYVAVGWTKFGKPVWSTRVIESDMHPIWNETTFIPVGHDEVNADERLKVQLWDSDRATADDELGTIELGLKELMRSSATKGKTSNRKDGLKGMKRGEKMPGTLEWSVGYFAKVGILPGQLQQQTEDKQVRGIDQLKQKVSDSAVKKLRESTGKNESGEIDQQKAQDLHATTTRMIASAPPSEDYPSGILSILVHQIADLELEKLNKTNDDNNSHDEEAQEGDDLPSSYCHVILNHTKIFRTRTKPKNAQPFFNAGTERFLRDWRTAEIMVSVRDARLHENDPILGIVVLPLKELFENHSQVNNRYPIFGGIGYGRIRISLMFRSVQLQLPRELRGWDYGTLQITSNIRSRGLSQEYTCLRLKVRTNVGKEKMRSVKGGWKGQKDRDMHLAVRKRYCSSLVIEFRKTNIGLDKTLAFAVIWLQDIPDEEDKTVVATVWRNDDNLKRAESCCDSELGQKLGSLEVPLKFWPGLSGYHKVLASKDENIRDLIEVLDCANEDKEAKTAADADTDESSGSDSGEDKPDESDEPALNEPPTIKANEHQQEQEHRGPIEQIKDYAAHKDEYHQRHRKLMQWKTPRTMKWMKTKLHNSGTHVTDRFGSKEREPGIETEQ